MLKETKFVKSKEEVISSLELEDYLNAYINDEDNSLKDKIIMSNFLNDYMDKDLYVVEFFRDGNFYIRVENDKDEILSGELFLGVEIEKEIDEIFETMAEDLNDNFDRIIKYCYDNQTTIDEIETKTIENDFNELSKKLAKENDEFLLENLDKIEHKYVGYRIKPVIPTINNTENEYSFKYLREYEFLGFDNLQEIVHWLEEGYSICEKSDLEKVRGLI